MLTQQLAQQQLAGLEASGLLEPHGDRFMVRAEFASGRLSINGRSCDQFLPGLLPAVLPSGEDSEV